MDTNGNIRSAEEWEEMIKMAQTEAYNQAIRDAAENAEANLYTEQGVGAYTEVDKESILKLLKK